MYTACLDVLHKCLLLLVMDNRSALPCTGDQSSSKLGHAWHTCEGRSSIYGCQKLSPPLLRSHSRCKLNACTSQTASCRRVAMPSHELHYGIRCAASVGQHNPEAQQWRCSAVFAVSSALEGVHLPRIEAVLFYDVLAL